MMRERCFISDGNCVTPNGPGRDFLWKTLNTQQCWFSDMRGWFVSKDFPIAYGGIIPTRIKNENLDYVDFSANMRSRHLELIDSLLETFVSRLKNMNVDYVFFSKGAHFSAFDLSLASNEVFGVSEFRNCIMNFFKKKSGVQIEEKNVICLDMACATGLTAIGVAKRLIGHRKAKNILVLGIDLSNAFQFSILNKLGVLSTECQDPRKASIPFSADRKGFTRGEGVAALLLQAESEITDGSSFLIEVAGCGHTSDGETITAGSTDAKGTTAAIQLAISEAKITMEEIDYIKAHGTGTPINDKHEVTALRNVFGARSTPVVSIKGYLGHCLNSSAVVETLAACMMIHKQQPFQNHRFGESGFPDPELKMNFDGHSGKKLNTILLNSSGFGGHNSSVVLKKVR